MSAVDLSCLLSEAYTRAIHGSPGEDRPSIRRAFGRAVAALKDGDPKPGILLIYRWP